MKRVPLRRKTELARGPGPERKAPLQGGSPLKRTKGVNARSARRIAEAAQRAEVRRIVLERAGWQCQYAPIIPEIPCGRLPDLPPLVVDELRGGSYRSTEYLDPDRCRATCPLHHDIKSANKLEIIRRLNGEPHGVLNPWL